MTNWSRRTKAKPAAAAPRPARQPSAKVSPPAVLPAPAPRPHPDQLDLFPDNL